jgi:uncharacterized protein
MNRNYFNIAFTPKVRAIQKALGALMSDDWRAPDLAQTTNLSPQALRFIAQRDSFYQATTSETGWPYVQHKGGPAGFLTAISPSILAYADFSGNEQYISAGNIQANHRVAIILTDYVKKERLKIFAIATLASPEAEPLALQALNQYKYKAKIERIVMLQVAAFNWNCPNHIHSHNNPQESNS